MTSYDRLRIVRRWDRSGLSASAFAPVFGVTPRTLCSWRRQAKRRELTSSQAPARLVVLAPRDDRGEPAARSDRFESVEIVPTTVKVVVHEITVCWCVACRGHGGQAKPPPRPVPRRYAGASLLAQVAVGKFADHAPPCRQESMLARSGLDRSHATMCG